MKKGKRTMQDKSKTPASEAPDSVEAIAKQFEAGIRKLVKESGGPMALYAQLGGAEKVSEMIIKPFYEALLQAEMDDHLGLRQARQASRSLKQTQWHR